MGKIILVTGATSGFGRSIALKFAKHGWNCIITGRRKERLDALAKDLSAFNVEVLSLNFDVRNRQEVMRNIASIPKSWQAIDVLVNNAGLALGRDDFPSADLDDWDTMIDTNIKGLLYVSKAVLPYMIQRNQGYIINIGSIAGKEVYPMGNVYNATKHAVVSISQSQRLELVKHNIRVTVINPGAALTEFSTVRFKGDLGKSNAVYEGFKPLLAEDIADITYYCVTLPEHVCINDLVVMPTAQASTYVLCKK